MMNRKDMMLSERSQFQSYLPYDSISMTFSKRPYYSDGEHISGCQGLGAGVVCVPTKGQHEGVWGDESRYSLYPDCGGDYMKLYMC